jgi:hypothetical protein
VPTARRSCCSSFDSAAVIRSGASECGAPVEVSAAGRWPWSATP